MCILCSAAGVPCSSCHDGEDGTGFQLCERCTFLIINANVSSVPCLFSLPTNRLINDHVLFFAFQLQHCPAPQLLTSQEVQILTANDQSPETGIVLLDSDQEDASRPSSEEVQVAVSTSYS